MKTLKEKLIELNACEPAVEWAGDKTIEEIWATCPRGHWMLWLFSRTNPEEIKLLFLASGHCANTVRHKMKDNRSILAVDAAIAFGNGEITKEELDKAAKGAYYNYSSAAADSAAAYAAYDDTAFAASAAAAYAADSIDSATAKIANQLLTADICRKYLPVPTI